MLVTPFFRGQGLGNQLANYVTMRSQALDHGYEWGVMFPENFKGSSFMNLNMGKSVVGGKFPVEGQEPSELPDGIERYYREAMIDNGKYDPAIFDILDNTIIHGNLQGEEYFKHNKDSIHDWLKVEPLEMPDDLCVINFRGGEYKYVLEFFLPQSYWSEAIEIMKEKNSNMRFEVHTDDPDTARSFFPDYPIIKDIGLNWRSIRYAKNLIISNSSFAWLPAWLNDDAHIIAPQFWGRRNKGYWHLEQNRTSKFNYI